MTDNTRPSADILLQQIADYVLTPLAPSALCMQTAHYALFDALGCAIAALNVEECTRFLGPIVPGIQVTQGAHVIGTEYYLDPVQATFNLSTMIRWLDYNDTWLAAEWGHPSDNLGAILAVAEYVSTFQQSTYTMRDILLVMIKAYEIQGIMALDHSFNKVGLDHVILVKLASTAVVTFLLGGKREDIIRALSQVWLDGGCLRTYRHAPNTGPRKSWAAGDAASRAVQLSLLTLRGEPGYPSALTAPKWGFQEVMWGGHEIRLAQPLATTVMEHILFKVRYPAEFHAQTAVEAAVVLHTQARDRLDSIRKIIVHTQEPAMRIIHKSGPLYNAADRDHCLQYMVAVALIYGKLEAHDYIDSVAADPRIDRLREKMEVIENPDYTRAYYNFAQRAIANAVQIEYADGVKSELIELMFPVGHVQRRVEAWPELENKFYKNVSGRFTQKRSQELLALMREPHKVLDLNVSQFVQLFI